MMTNPTPLPVKFEIFDERRTAVFRSPFEPGGFKMDTEAVEAALQMFGLARAEMLPAVPAEWPRGQMVRGVFRDPAFDMEADQLAGDPLLHIRHQRFGWLHFIITKAEARKLGEALIAQADAPPPSAAGSA